MCNYIVSIEVELYAPTFSSIKRPTTTTTTYRRVSIHFYMSTDPISRFLQVSNGSLAFVHPRSRREHKSGRTLSPLHLPQAECHDSLFFYTPTPATFLATHI